MFWICHLKRRALGSALENLGWLCMNEKKFFFFQVANVCGMAATVNAGAAFVFILKNIYNVST